MRAQHARDRQQEPVSLGVTEGVVDGLEIVEIEIGDREWPLVAARTADFVFARFVERATIADTGEEVGARKVLQRVRLLLHARRQRAGPRQHDEREDDRDAEGLQRVLQVPP